MRIRHVAALTAAILLCALALPRVATAQARPLVTMRSDSWCPYNCAPGSDHPGYAIEIARIVFADAGYDVDYQLMNWARSLEEARQGRADAVIGAYATDVPGFVIPREPIGVSAQGFAVRRGVAFRYVDTDSLKGRVLGAVATYEFAGSLGDYIRTYRNDHARVQLVAGEDALAKNLAKLLAGHLDVVLDDSNVLVDTIADLKLGGQVVASTGTESAAVFIAFSPANPSSARLATILSDGIARLRASGSLAAILARYGVRDWAGWEKHLPVEQAEPASGAALLPAGR